MFLAFCFCDRRADELGFVGTQIDVVFLQAACFTNRFAALQEQIGTFIFVDPAFCCNRNPATDAQVFAVLIDPLAHTRPVPQQRLVGDSDHRVALIRQLGHEQTGTYKSIDKGTTLRGRNLGQRCTFPANGFVTVVLQADQCIQNSG